MLRSILDTRGIEMCEGYPRAKIALGVGSSAWGPWRDEKVGSS